jgi:hypothetical protein
MFNFNFHTRRNRKTCEKPERKCKKNFNLQNLGLNISPSIHPFMRFKIFSFKNLKCSLLQTTPAIWEHFVNFVHAEAK